MKSTSFVVVGLNHRTAPIAVLERLTISDDSLPKALHHLLTYEHILEGFILSTCNRIEVAAVVSKFHGGAQDLRNFLAEFCHVAPEDFADNLYTYHDEGAVRHLFRVAAGVDSMVLGESEILGQVRRAFQRASDEQAARRVLGRALRQALTVGKRARTETAIGRNPVSVSSAAVELARRAFGGESLAHKRVLIVGAGKMGSLAVRALAQAGSGEVTVVNRNADKARAVAALAGVATRPWAELESLLERSDIVICSTTSPHAVLDGRLVAAAASGRPPGSSQLIVDIAVPRDVDPTVAEVPGVVLRDIDDLRGVVEGNMGSRIAEVSGVEDIITEEVARFLQWEAADEIAPVIASLVARGDGIRRAELKRSRPRLAELTPDQAAAVEHLTRRTVAKLLHGPVTVARRLAASKQGHVYLEALRELFELEDDPDA